MKNQNGSVKPALQQRHSARLSQDDTVSAFKSLNNNPFTNRSLNSNKILSSSFSSTRSSPYSYNSSQTIGKNLTNSLSTSNTTPNSASKPSSSSSSTWVSSSVSKYKSKSSSIRNNKPAELYRTDFVSAMKLADNEVLDENSYWVIRDTWRLEWEKGVQVPVKPDSLNQPNFIYKPDQFQSSVYINSKKNPLKPAIKPATTIKMPKKFLCPANDKNYKPAIHEAYITHGLLHTESNSSMKNSSASLICKYDSDEMDIRWLNRVNLEYDMMGVERLTRVNFERLIENFELQSYEYLKHAIDKLQSYSIEYDENIVCDVCRSPDSEDSNEMVFCDGCNMCVHQACYGIEKIPQGNWLCSPCSFGGSLFKPECVLCPNTGGAMKPTKNYRHWAHVSCALWIPETGFGNPDKMEPIVDLNKIIAPRWQLVCSLCKEKRGCCLQCNEKRCHAAFHVTCAFKHNLEMQTLLISDSNEEITFKSYCSKHTKKRMIQHQKLNSNEDEEEEEEDEDEDETVNNDNQKVNTSSGDTSIKKEETDEMDDEEENEDDDDDLNQSKFLSSLSKMSENERKIEIIKRIQFLNYKFYKKVNLDFTQSVLQINQRIHVEMVFNYWKLKRRFNVQTISHPNSNVIPVANKALMLQREEQDLMNRSERLLIARVRMFIHLRQDLERVRNLCYMVAKREKLKRQYYQINRTLFEKQADYLNKYSAVDTSATGQQQQTPTSSLRSGRIRDILQTKHENCIYDYPDL